MLLLCVSAPLCLYDPNPAPGFCVAEAHLESLFCVDELDSLFSYFNSSAKPRHCKYSCLCPSRCLISVTWLSKIQNVTLLFHEYEFELNWSQILQDFELNDRKRNLLNWNSVKFNSHATKQIILHIIII